MSMDVEEAVRKALNEAVREAQEACIQKAVLEFEQQLRKRVAQAALTISSFYHFERMGDELVIRVQIEKGRS